MNCRLRITLLSDACFSMPASSDAVVDTNIALDMLGLPMIPGKTIHGLLRDTWLATGDMLGTADEAIALLGSERDHNAQGLLRIGDALLEEETRRWIARRVWETKKEQVPLPEPALREAFTENRTLTAIDRETGAPQTETLRIIRILPANTTLYASLETVGDVNWDLLHTLATLTRHAGLHRNRGLGHVEIVVENCPPDRINLPVDLQMQEALIRYRLTLTAPCLISDRQVEPNSSRSLPYIPGSTVRGAVAAGLVRQGATAEVLHRILVSGEVRFLNAYPSFDDRRALPARGTWRRRKDATRADGALKPDETWDLLDELTAQIPYSGKHQREPLHEKFFVKAGKQRPVKVHIKSCTHQRRQRETGISKEGEADVFVYEAIAPDQSFIGLVALPLNDPVLRKQVLEALSGTLWLGRSARAQYGGAPIVELIGEGDSELDEPLTNISVGEEFDIRLTSDVVLRDPNTGQHDPWQLKAELVDRFGGVAEVLAVAVKSTHAVGYNRLWRARLPEVPAAAAGGSARLRALKDIDDLQLRSLEGKPLGERVAEGKGCFVIERPTGAPSIDTPSVEVEPKRPPEGEATPHDVETAQARLYAGLVRALVADQAVRDANNADGVLPPPSQIQRMRTPLRDPKWTSIYQDLLAGPKGKKLTEEAIQKLKAIRLEGVSLYDRLLMAAKGSWHPSPDSSVRDLYRLIGEKEAKRIWDKATQESTRLYIDALHNALARRKKHEAGKLRKGGPGNG